MNNKRGSLASSSGRSHVTSAEKGECTKAQPRL